MSKHINADEIIADLEEWKQNPSNDNGVVVLVSHFQGMLRAAPSIKTKTVKYFDEDEKVWTTGEVIVNE